MPSAANVVSLVGLSLLALLGVGLTLAVGHMIDPCNMVKLPDVANALTNDECFQIISAGIKGLPKAKQGPAAEMVFGLTGATRIEGGLFLGLSIASLYAMSLPFEQRHVALAVILPIVIFPPLVDAGHAGLVLFGANAFTTEAAKDGANIARPLSHFSI